MGEISKNYKPELASAVMVMIITDAAKFFSVGNGMDKHKLDETVRLIMKNYYFLTIADFRLFFDDLKCGKYGETYNRLDGNVILTNLGKFVKERTTVAETLALDTHDNLKIEQAKNIYIVKIGDDVYIRQTDEGLEEISSREFATTFDFKTAYKLVGEIQKHHYPDGKTKVSMIDSRKSTLLLEDHIKKENPELLTEAKRYHLATDDYFKKKEAIMNSDKSPLEKFNAVRELSGMLPLDKDEYKKFLKLKYKIGEIKQ